jgi:hypothetical protein
MIIDDEHLFAFFNATCLQYIVDVKRPVTDDIPVKYSERRR